MGKVAPVSSYTPAAAVGAAGAAGAAGGAAAVAVLGQSLQVDAMLGPVDMPLLQLIRGATQRRSCQRQSLSKSQCRTRHELSGVASTCHVTMLTPRTLPCCPAGTERDTQLLGRPVARCRPCLSTSFHFQFSFVRHFRYNGGHTMAASPHSSCLLATFRFPPQLNHLWSNCRRCHHQPSFPPCVHSPHVPQPPALASCNCLSFQIVSCGSQEPKVGTVNS